VCHLSIGPLIQSLILSFSFFFSCLYKQLDVSYAKIEAEVNKSSSPIAPSHYHLIKKTLIYPCWSIINGIMDKSNTILPTYFIYIG
jgi:hypothetical protein